MSTDRELLEAAAKAAGYVTNTTRQPERDRDYPEQIGLWNSESTCWNPLKDDGQALRLAVKLKMRIAIDSLPIGYVAIYACDSMMPDTHEPIVHEDTAGATRRAIVRAAASMAKEKAE